jgi:catechol 2,3-dioxygenase-like lactoylglutathione lyase family enzyme
MSRHIGLITLVVRDYDEAIDWFTRKLGFLLVEDTPLADAKRWVVVTAGDGGAPPPCQGGWRSTGGIRRQPDPRAGCAVSLYG